MNETQESFKVKTLSSTRDISSLIENICTFVLGESPRKVTYNNLEKISRLDEISRILEVPVGLKDHIGKILELK